MDYSEALIKIEQSLKELHNSILHKYWVVVDIEADNIVFLANQVRDSVSDLK